MADTALNNQLKFDFDVICFSHLRWDFVYQRPQHLMSRFAGERRVFVFEEPVFSDEPAHLDVTTRGGNIHIAVPKLPHGTEPGQIADQLRAFVNELIEKHGVRSYLSWYYTPMMLEFSRHLTPVAVVYDCMDKL
jgi:ribonuclease BN (tRNA processing enzyme)